MLDTKGPEIRTGYLVDGKNITIEKDSVVEITTDYSVLVVEEAHLADKGRLPPHLVLLQGPAHLRQAEPADLRLRRRPDLPGGGDWNRVCVCFSEVNSSSIQCRALNTATIGETKNMNIPGAIITLPTLTESVRTSSFSHSQDIHDIAEFPLHHRVDCIAASFIRKASDIDNIRKVLGPQLQHIQIIAKIENQEGLQNYEAILEKVDGIMVARGDLGMEMAPEKVFLAQKYMLHEAALKGRFTITATQMLDSMIRKPR